MRKIILLFLALPLFAMAQDNVISVSRYFPKPDKVLQFEKALAAHAQKYHSGDVKWRVATIETGPDAGGYHVVEGPKSWDSEDKRGDLGKAHMSDWHTTVQSLLTDRGTTSYFVYRKDLSTSDLTDYSDKYLVERIYYKPGYYGETQEHVQSLKKVWEQSNQTIAVYEASSSGEPHFAIVTRYKQGLKERETTFREPLNTRYIKAHGQDAWNKWVAGRKEMLSRQSSELLFTRPELSSK